MPPDRVIPLRQHTRRSPLSPLHTRAPVPPAGTSTTTTTGERRTSGVGVLMVVWCCSVGTTWTVELHEPGPGATLGRLVDWISSGVPIGQPKPDEATARTLLATRGLHLYPDSTLGPATSTRRSIGYASEDPKVITRAHQIRAAATVAGVHPVMLALHQIAAGDGLHPHRAEPQHAATAQ
jgi:hypothetical protein